MTRVPRIRSSNNGERDPLEDAAFTTDHPRRDELIAIAAQQFDTIGFDRVSMSDLAKASGVAKATLYHYFESKDEILYSIHDQCINYVVEKHRRRLEETDDCEELLRGIVSDNIEIVEIRGSYVRSFFDYRRGLPESYNKKLRVKRKAYLDSCIAVIDQGVAEGVFEVEDSRLAAHALFGMCTWTFQWFSTTGPDTGRDVAEKFWLLLRNGFFVRPKSGGKARAKRPAKSTAKAGSRTGKRTTKA